MATCPICSSEIKDDFGLVTCGSCGAQVMIEIDGSMPEHPQMPSADVSLSAASMPSIPPPLEVPSFSGELSQIIQEEILSQPKVMPVEVPPVAPDMSDVAAFGNSVTSQGREGMLRFNLHISGIDSADIRVLVRDALMDERFLWDAEKIISEMVDGQLSLKEITAVKSALLVQKLRAVPVEIRWEQYAIYQN